MTLKKLITITLLVFLFPIIPSASPLIFSNSFESPTGSIEFVSDESVLFTQTGDSSNFEVIVKDYLGNVINTGDVQWSLSSTNNLSVTDSQSRTATINANTFNVSTVIVTAFHPEANATGQANIILADLNDKTKVVFDTDVISGVTPLTGNQTTVVLHKNSRTEIILAGDYVISGQNTGLLITVDAISIGATDVTITASPASIIQVFDEFRFDGASQVTKYHAKVSAIDNTIKVYSQKNGQLIQQKSFYDAFSCKLINGEPVGFSLTDASIDFDFTVHVTPEIYTAFFTGYNSFSLLSTTTITAAATTGSLSFDSSITDKVNCKIELSPIETLPVFVYGLSFQLAAVPELGFGIDATISGPRVIISGPSGIANASSTQGIKYTATNGWEYISSNNSGFEYDLLSGYFTHDIQYNIAAELYVLAKIKLLANLGKPPLFGIELADVSFMEIKAAEELNLSVSLPTDPEDITYTGPTADLTGHFTITPKAELAAGNLVELMKKVGVDATFNIAFDPLVDSSTVHWNSPVTVIMARNSAIDTIIDITTGNYLEDGTTFIVNNNNSGTFSLLSENLNPLTGSINNGTGSVIRNSPTDSEIFYPRIQIDALSRLLPYAGAPTTIEGYTPITTGFTKLDINGYNLPDSATSWSCVRQNTTGLVWEVKTDNGGIHDKDNIYRWGGITSLGTDGDHFSDWDSLVNGSNNSGFCGGSNWRVPNIAELESIVYCSSGQPIVGEDERLDGCPSGSTFPTINTNFFPNTYLVGFWSASPNANDSSNAWGVLFNSGVSGFGSRDFSRYVRLVRFDQ